MNMSTSIAAKPSNASISKVELSQTRDVFDDFEAITKAIAQRAFGFFQQRGTDGRDSDDWFRAESELLKPVPIEISESGESYTIRAEVPGFDAKDLSVRTEGNSVYIHGKTEQKKEEKKGKEVKYSEVSATELCRRIDLPSAIISEKASANLANGVLELTLPKTASPKKIEVKAA
jgi:HSP20 family protein